MANGAERPGGASSIFDLESLAGDGFSWQAAVSLASASKLSYEPRHVVESIATQSWGFTQVVFFDEGETQAFLAEASDVALVAFRGTRGLADWLGNFNVAKVDSPFGAGEVHEGFLDAYVQVREQILAALGPNESASRRLWLTGHSLGGALVALAAADFQAQGRRFTAAMTYGQPRIGDEDFCDHFDGLSGDCFFRFVNDEDLVTRVPPGWKHVGQLIHFDDSGDPMRVGPAEAEAEEALPALSDEEFDLMQQGIRSVGEALRESGVSETDSAAESEASVEGLFPSIGDHRIDLYIAAIRRQLPGNFVDVALGRKQAGRRPRAAAGTEVEGISTSSPTEVPVVLRVAEDGWQPPMGVTINSRMGTFVSALTTDAGLALLKADSSVLVVEASRDAATEELDTSISFARGDVVQRPPLDERGDSALVGVIDEGIDVLHDAFTDEQGATRILAVWSQRDTAGPTPYQLDPEAFQPDYGTVYTSADIDGMRTGARPAPSSLRDRGRHGTHVASIAAGRSVGDCPVGMAPEAGIIVVIPNMTTVSGDPPSLGYSASHADALHFLRRVAAGGNAVVDDRLPLAINVSLGMNAGAHDGTTLVEAIFDAATGKGREPGVVIVKSAGNERGHGGHARTRAAKNGVVDVIWDSAGFRFQDYLEAWYNAADELEFQLMDPQGNISPTVSRDDPNISADLGGNLCHLSMVELHHDNGDNRFTLSILPVQDAIQEGRWTLNITGANVRSSDGWVDIWVERNNSRAVTFNPREQNITLSIPGTADTVITVGACGAQDPVNLASFSSYGRTRKGAPKPDIVAPGIDIRAAQAATEDHEDTVVKSGTSMAAPHVTGALALVLSRRHKNDPSGQYNAQQLRQALNLTARNRGGFHHEGFGWGALDAEALFNHLI